MQIVVSVNREELAQMEASEEELQEAVARAMEGGLEAGHDTLYLSNVNVVVRVQD